LRGPPGAGGPGPARPQRRRGGHPAQRRGGRVRRPRRCDLPPRRPSPPAGPPRPRRRLRLRRARHPLASTRLRRAAHPPAAGAARPAAAGTLARTVVPVETKPTGTTRGEPMPTYTFRCDSCDELTAVLPMSELRPTRPCPRCARESRRVYGVAPALLSTPAGLRRGIEAAAAS